MVQLPVLYMVRAWEYLVPYTHLYHAWNMPVPCTEYACTMHGICLYQAWNMPVPRMEYGLKHACFMHGIGQIPCMKYQAVVHACNMHSTYL